MLAGLEVVELATVNHFDLGSREHRAFVALERVVPSRLRDGVTATFQEGRATRSKSSATQPSRSRPARRAHPSGLTRSPAR